MMPPPDKNTSVFPHGHIDRSTWKRVRLGDVCSIKARIGWQGLKKSEHLDFGNYCLVSGTDFYNGFVNWKTCSYVSEWRYAQDTNIQLTNGDVLITKDGTIGKIAYVQGMAHPTTLNSGVFVIRPRSNELHPAFLQLVFKSRFFTDFLDKITAGSTIVHLYQKDIIDFEFPIPDIDTQLLIEKSISAIDECIKDQKSCIAKYEAIKKSTVNLLLKPKAGWQEKPLGDLSFIKTGGKNTQDAVASGQYPFFVRSPNVERINTYSYDGEAVLVAGDGVGAGKVFHYINGKHDCHQRVYRVCDFNSEVLGLYIYRSLSELFPIYMERSNDKASVDSLRLPAFKEFLVHYPNIDEQKRIVAILDSIDGTINGLKSQLAKVQDIKQGMMSCFFG